jgi:hypothetical protein
MYPVKILMTIFIAWICLSSCGGHKKLLSKRELEKYISKSENGLVKLEEVNGFKIRVSFQPSSLMIAREITDSNKTDSLFIKVLEKKYATNYYFFLNYSKGGKEAIRQLGSFSKYSKMLQVFAFKMNDFVNLTTAERDTIPLSDYLFEQTNGISRGNSMMLIFAKEKISLAGEVEINIAECGLGTGNLKFRFRKADLTSPPDLDYHNIE